MVPEEKIEIFFGAFGGPLNGLTASGLLPNLPPFGAGPAVTLNFKAARDIDRTILRGLLNQVVGSGGKITVVGAAGAVAAAVADELAEIARDLAPRPPGDRPGIAIVVAVSRDGHIGAAGKLPWHIPIDLLLFRGLTLGGMVLMGRRTWQSIGSRPLPGRLNIVMTRGAAHQATSAPETGEGAGKPGTEVAYAGSLGEALDLAAARRHAWGGWLYVIGGTEVYAQTEALADALYVSLVETTVPDGDATYHVPPDTLSESVSVRFEGAPSFTWSVRHRLPSP